MCHTGYADAVILKDIPQRADYSPETLKHVMLSEIKEMFKKQIKWEDEK